MSLNKRIESIEVALEHDRKSEGIWVGFDTLDGEAPTSWRNALTGEIRDDPPEGAVALHVKYDEPA